MKEQWLEDIECALIMCSGDDCAARLIMQWLNRYHKVTFGPDCLPWIRTLVAKWRRKTPDVKQQAESIAGAIFKRLVPQQKKEQDERV